MTKFAGRFNVLAFDAQKHPELTGFFDLRTGFPAAVIYSPPKHSSTVYVGAFEYDSLESFLDNVLIGKKRLYPVKGDLPSVVDEKEHVHKSEL